MINGASALSTAFTLGLSPPPRLTVTEWADQYRRLPTKGSGEPGRWRTSRVPYMGEIMDCLSAQHPARRVVLMKSAQVAGPLAIDTPIPTPDGWATMGDLQPGDRVFDERGQPTRVLGVSPIFHDRPCWELAFSDGSTLVADSEHRWTVHDSRATPETLRTLTTDELRSDLKFRTIRNRYSIPVTQPLTLPEADLPIHPYALGVWLGDGNNASAQITIHEDDAEEMAQRLMEVGHPAEIRHQRWVKGHTRNLIIQRKHGQKDRCLRGHVIAEVGVYRRKKSDGRAFEVCAECQRQHSMHHQYSKPLDPVINDPPSFHRLLASLHVLKNKHIPSQYLRASYGQRLALLQGLVDTDGHIGKNGRAAITTVCPLLAGNILELVTGLGLKPKLKQQPPRLIAAGRPVKTPRPYYRVDFLAYTDQPVARLTRKASQQVSREGRRITETQRRRIVDIRPHASVPVRCISVASDRHLFLAGRAMIPTHNTEIGLNWIGWFIQTQRAPFMAVQPTIDVAERFSKQRLASMIDDCPELRELIPPARSRDSGNTTLLKEYPGGIIILSGANSAASLRSLPVRYLFLDEVDAYPHDLDGEGDPISLAEARTTTFPRRKIFLCSTPTIESLSRINREWLASDQRRYHVPCPHCSAFNPLRWENLRWPDGEPDRAVYTCPACHQPIPEHHKTALLAAGVWIAERPDSPTPGFHLNGLYAPIGLGLTWVEMAKEWESKKRDPFQQKTFINTRLGECFADPDEKLDWDELKNRAEPYEVRTIPAGCLLLTAGIDVQKDRFALLVLGHGRGGVCWIIDYVELPADPTRPDDWLLLDDALTTPIGNLKITVAAIDSGYLPDDVLHYTRNRRGKVIAIKGSSTPGKPIISKPSKVDFTWKGSVIKAGAEQWQIGHDAAKHQLFARLIGDRKCLPPDRMIHFPTGLDDSFYGMLTAEIWDSTKRRWVKIRSRNEALDSYVYAMAAAMQPALRIHTWHEANWRRWESAQRPDLFSAPTPEAAPPAPVKESLTPPPAPAALPRQPLPRQSLTRQTVTRRSL